MSCPVEVSPAQVLCHWALSFSPGEGLHLQEWLLSQRNVTVHQVLLHTCTDSPLSLHPPAKSASIEQGVREEEKNA